MTNFKHLTKTDLAAYSSGSLEKNELQTLGRHLLKCTECRKLLPMPGAERFWSVVMTDAEITGARERAESESCRSSLFSILKLNYGFVWSGAALIMILGFSFLLWSGSADTSREFVRIFENEFVSQPNFPPPTEIPINENPAISTGSNRGVDGPPPKISKTAVPNQKTVQNNLRQNFSKPNLKQQKETFAATRGISAKCSENNTVESEVLSNKENLVFRWKAVSKATRYHLYISDDEEILLDEYETEAETSFVLKKPLDPLKTYKWKIIVTLENGNTVVGDSRKFTMKDFQTNQKNIETNKSSATRCLANG
jgi:hypothetical protein